MAVDFQNVNFHLGADAVLEVGVCRGLVPTRPGAPPSFDDLKSYTLRIERRSRDAAGSLTAVLNNFVFNYEGAPIQCHRLNRKWSAEAEGTLHKGVAVPFTIVADMTVTPDGRIRLHPTSVKAVGLRRPGS